MLPYAPDLEARGCPQATRAVMAAEAAEAAPQAEAAAPPAAEVAAPLPTGNVEEATGPAGTVPAPVANSVDTHVA